MTSRVEIGQGKNEQEAKENLREKIGNSKFEIFDMKEERVSWWFFWRKNVTIKAFVELQNQNVSLFENKRIEKRTDELIKLLKQDEVEEKEMKEEVKSSNEEIKKEVKELDKEEPKVENNELLELKNLIIELKDKVDKNEENKLPLALERSKRILTEREIEESLVKKIVKEVYEKVNLELEIEEIKAEKEIEAEMKKIIENKIKIDTPISALNTKIIALVGPTGVGKTTTIAKIGWEFYKAKKTVGFITTDVFRSGAKEQLEKFAKKMDFELKVANNVKQLKDALIYFQNVNPVDHILIDTVGKNMLEEESLNLIKDYLDISNPCSTSLVISATSKVSDIKEILNNFKDIKINSLIFTKTDETLNLGSVLNIFDYTNLPLLYITDGQDITKNIYSPDKEMLFNRIYYNQKIETKNRKVLA